MHSELTSTRYCRSPLGQGGLEIIYCVTIKTQAILLHQKFTEQYLKLVVDTYAQPNDDTTDESIFEELATLPSIIGTQFKNIAKKKERKQGYQGDVRCKRTGKNGKNVRGKTRPKVFDCN